MPHLIIDRLRDAPVDLLRLIPCINVNDKRGRSITFIYLIEILEIIAGIFFIWGSVDFLPQYSNERIYLLHACELFSAGGAIYLGISLYSLSEAVEHKGFRSFEVVENILYCLGALLFEIGTLLYWPFHLQDEAVFETSLAHSKWHNMGLPVYLNYGSREFKGTELFIIGSVLFALAAFANGLNQRDFRDFKSQLMTATTSMYMLGSVLFIMGSVAFLPDMGCNQKMEGFGGWCFITGSIQYEIGGWLSLVRTSLEVRDGQAGVDDESDETTPLKEDMKA